MLPLVVGAGSLAASVTTWIAIKYQELNSQVDQLIQDRRNATKVYTQDTLHGWIKPLKEWLKPGLRIAGKGLAVQLCLTFVGIISISGICYLNLREQKKSRALQESFQVQLSAAHSQYARLLELLIENGNFVCNNSKDKTCSESENHSVNSQDSLTPESSLRSSCSVTPVSKSRCESNSSKSEDKLRKIDKPKSPLISSPEGNCNSNSNSSASKVLRRLRAKLDISSKSKVTKFKKKIPIRLKNTEASGSGGGDKWIKD